MSETAAAAAAARTSVCSSVRYYAAVADRRKAVVGSVGQQPCFYKAVELLLQLLEC